jgi:phosphate acetyltransferase
MLYSVSFSLLLWYYTLESFEYMEDTNMTMKKIVLPEGDSERVLSAVQGLLNQGVCHPILIGDEAKISAEIEATPQSYTVIAPDSSELDQLKASAIGRGKTFPVKDEYIAQCIAQGAALVRDGRADGIVSGANTATDEVFRIYVKTIPVREDVSRATDCFLMEKEHDRFILAGGGLNVESDTQQLAEMAYLAAKFAKTVGIEPIVALISFQTIGSAQHPSVQWISEAAKVARETYGLKAAGPLQWDSARYPEVAARKTKDCDVAGNANVFVFPRLEAGNPMYKALEREAGFQATGPLFLGFVKPAYDLSRGCSTEDIINVVRMAVKHVA